MALIFEYQSTSTTQAKYASGLRDMVHVTVGGTALTLTAGGGTVFGGTFLDVSSPANPVIDWAGHDNCPVGVTAFSVLWRVVPVATGNLAALTSLIAIGNSKVSFGTFGSWAWFVDTANKLRVTGGKNITSIEYFSGATSSGAFTFTAGTATDIGFSWDGTTTAGHGKITQDGVLVGTVTASNAMVAGVRGLQSFISCIDPSDGTTNHLLHYNGIAIFNTAEDFTAGIYPGRTGHIYAGGGYEGYTSTALAANTVLAGTVYGPGPGTLTGTLPAGFETGTTFIG